MTQDTLKMVTFAMAAQPDGAFSDIESAIRAAHGPEASGFELIDRNEDGLSWRLALIDSARHSIDVQYYLWYGDAAGRILAGISRRPAPSNM
jgi:putative cardiolipin synthase